VRCSLSLRCGVDSPYRPAPFSNQMASRTKQKEEARSRRLAEERERAERARAQRRLWTIGGVVLVAVAIAAVAIAISSGGGKSDNHAPKNLAGSAAQQSATTVNSLLTGIPQSAMRLGSPSAPVTITEFGDLECPVCRDFALTGENTLISKDVRAGKVQLVYKSLSTATANGPNPSVFGTQQAAAYAAGLQNRAWNYILNFYHLQGTEDTGYVNTSYLNGIAKLVPGLDFAKWSSQRTEAAMTQDVSGDQQTAASDGFNSTPTLIVQGPKGAAQPLVGDVPYSDIAQDIKLVS